MNFQDKIKRINEIRALVGGMYDDATGEISCLYSDDYERLTAELHEILQTGEHAAAALVDTVRQLDSEIAAWETKIEADTKSKKEREKSREWCREQLLRFAELQGGKTKVETFDGRYFSLFVRSNQRVHVFDEALLPPAFKTEVVTVKCDKRAIKDALNSGAHVEGAKIIESASLTIK